VGSGSGGDVERGVTSLAEFLRKKENDFRRVPAVDEKVGRLEAVGVLRSSPEPPSRKADDVLDSLPVVVGVRAGLTSVSITRGCFVAT
jgi:hypothetical protein